MKQEQLREGDIFHYRPANSWCRHGSAMVKKRWDGELFAQDTYWDGLSDRSSEYGIVSFDLILAGEYVGNRDDFRVVHRHEYSQYAQKDRFYLPTGGGSEAHYVRKDAKPDAETAVDYLREKIRDEESKISSAKYHMAEYQKEIDALLLGERA